MPDLIFVSLDPARIKVQQGIEATANILIKNRSEEVENFSLSLEGVPAEWGEITPSQLSAFPFQEVRAKIAVHLPAGVQPAVYRMTICAASAERNQSSGSTTPSVGRGLLEVEVSSPTSSVQTPPTPTFAPPSVGEVAGPVPTKTSPAVRSGPFPGAGEERTVQAARTPSPLPAQPANAARPAPVRPQTASQIELRVEPSQENPPPPPAMQWKLRLKNAGNVLDTFGFSFNGIAQNWVVIDPVEMQLYPGEEGAALLVVRPPADTKAGAYAFTLRAFSHVNMNQRTEVALKIEIKATLGFTLEVTPKEAEIQGARDFQIYLSSSPAANGDMWLDLAAHDQDNACDYTFQPKEILLPARQRVMSTLRIKPRPVLGPNERKQYTVKVEAIPRAAVAPTQGFDLRVTQTGSQPPSLTLQPQVQSAERESDYVVVVANPSAVDVNLYFSADDPEMACEFAFNPDRRYIPANGTTSIRLHVKTRAANSGQAAKQITFSVKATRGGELLPAATVQGQLNQTPGKPLSVQLIPPQLSSTGQAKYSTRVHNPYSGPILVWLEARDETDAVSFSLSPQRLQIPAGGDGLFEVRAKPKDKLLPTDQRRVHKFIVSVHVQGLTTPTTVNGLLAQVKGFDWGTPIGKFFSFILALLKFFWNILKWLIPVILILILIIFVSDLIIATLYYIVLHDNQLGPIITGLVPKTLIFSLHNSMLFRSISDSIAETVMNILGVMGSRMNPPPIPAPTPTSAP